MPKREFALEDGGPKRITMSWSGLWKNIQLTFDGKPLGTIANQSELKQGRQFSLPDGSSLHVQLVTGLSAELRLTRNGAPLPGSGSDPAERLKAAYGIIFFIAGLNGIAGVIAGVFHVRFLENLGLGWTSLAFAAVYAGLGFAVKSYRSSLALGIAVALFGIDSILSLAMAASGGGTPNMGGIVARIFFIMPMIRGFGAIGELKKKPARIEGGAVPEGVGSKGQPWDPPRKG